jgi:hypothetical protein
VNLIHGFDTNCNSLDTYCTYSLEAREAGYLTDGFK